VLRFRNLRRKGKPQRKRHVYCNDLLQQTTLCKIFKKLFFQDLYRSFFKKNLDSSLPLLTLDKFHGNLQDLCKALVFLYKWEVYTHDRSNSRCPRHIFSSEPKSCLHFFTLTPERIFLISAVNFPKSSNLYLISRL
jgi:hypothetical protein